MPATASLKSLRNGSANGRSLPGAKSAEQLLAATAALLATRSALDVSLSDIARLSGLNSALIKYYFGNKEGLMLALLERESIIAMDALNNLIQMNIPAVQKLRIHIGGMLNAYYKAPYLNRLIHYMIEYSEAGLSRRVEELYTEPLKAAYRALVDQGVAEGTFRQVDPLFLYYNVVGACDHLFVANYSDRDETGARRISMETKQQYAQHVIEICLGGLTPKT
jgi:TetR/AcrR family transcriptional regulator